jgi:hypothetical protein
MANINFNRHEDTEKNVPLQIDDVATSEKDLKAQTALDGADYTGAIAKTDPAEIALVRKLDMRVMPALFCMYFLYVNQSSGFVPPSKDRLLIVDLSATNLTRTRSQMRDSTTSKTISALSETNTTPVSPFSTSDTYLHRYPAICSCLRRKSGLHCTWRCAAQSGVA